MNVFSLSWAAAGLALLGLSLFPAGSLALGGAVVSRNFRKLVCSFWDE